MLGQHHEDQAARLQNGPIAPALVLTLACVGCLAPFAGKAFHIDDPLFVWTAQHIRERTGDFYGFPVNWYFESKPMSEVTKNPPLACYYLSFVGTIFGWSETPLHLALVLPALGMLWGTYRLAEFFGSRPLLAALVTLLTPAFLVSGTTVMCDTILGFFWVWAIVCWERASRLERPWLLFCSGFLIGLSALTKYFGISLLPLLLVYSIASKQKLGRCVAALAIPIVMIGAYQWITENMYGQGLLQGAADYARTVQNYSATRISPIAKFLTGLAFTGGCSASAIFFVPFLWPKRWLWPTLGVVLAIVWLLYYLGALGPFLLIVDGKPRWDLIIQEAIFCAGGICILVLAGMDLYVRRDAGALLLALWVAGTFVFTAFVNWSINGRSILPMVPAVGILVMRRLDFLRAPAGNTIEWRLSWPLVPAGLLGLLVTGADYQGANAARAAATLAHSVPGRTGRLWFQCHWGFQYYMESLGAQCLDKSDMHCAVGDWIVKPDDNYGRFAMPKETTRDRSVLLVPSSRWVTTMHRLQGAGFYSNHKGPLPFTFGAVPDSEYLLLEVVKPVEGPLQLSGE
jgi:4-amino-4-deoxy-L-arabinose transferase-like glycosyltransferase